MSQSTSARILQNYLLVWLGENIDTINNIDGGNIMIKIGRMISSVNMFSDPDQCLDFITDINEEKIFLIISEFFSENIIQFISEIAHVASIYILTENSIKQWRCVNQHGKIKDVPSDITQIDEAIAEATLQHDLNSISMTFVPPDMIASKEGLDQLDPSFMYTQIFKEILLTVDFEQESIRNFAIFCHEQFGNNKSQQENVEKFEREYRHHSPIWWYTQQIFVYSILNKALRTFEVDVIINMGFFIHDLHENIAQLHSEQYTNGHFSRPLTVYRGQGLTHTDFTKLMKTHGGLMAFNNFFSTSTDRSVAFLFAEANSFNPELVGILFQVTIHPSTSSTPFANIRDISQHSDEAELLFSMHSVFRVEQVRPMDNNNRLWQVNLTLTSATDPELNILTEFIRAETAPTQSGWYRLGHFLIKLGWANKGEQLYKTLLHRTSDNFEQAKLYHQLVCASNEQGKYAEAIKFYQISNEILQNILSPNDPFLAASYASIGSVYENMGDYRTAISYYEKDLAIMQMAIPPDYLSTAISYNNIAVLYEKMADHSKALSFHEKALHIREKYLPSNHPELASTYANIGLIYANLEQLSKSLSYYEKSLEIREKSLPSTHPRLSHTYNGIGLVHRKMGEYATALSYYEKALEIGQQLLPPDHPHIACFYCNIGSIYEDMGDYSKAASYYEKDLAIVQKTLPANHPDVATSYNNIGLLYAKRGEYSKALSYHEKAFEIQQNSENHGDVFSSYNNIGTLYFEMNQYSKATFYLEKAIEIGEIFFPPNHSNLIQCYENIMFIYSTMKEYSKAIVFYEKLLAIRQNILPLDHPDLITLYNDTGTIYLELGDYTKALSYFGITLRICQNNLPGDHPDLMNSHINIARVHMRMKNYKEAVPNFEKAYEIQRKNLSSNHPELELMREALEFLKGQS